MRFAPVRPLQDAPDLQVLKQACYSCPMFDICNGCHETIAELKETQQVESHCQHMKRLAPRILAVAGVDAELTPYVKEYDEPDTTNPTRLKRRDNHGPNIENFREM